MLTLLLPFFLFLQSNAQEGPAFAWVTPTSFDFGDLTLNVSSIHDFKFKNTGDAPLMIDNVRSVCSCTATEWTETPVLPGKEGYIRVEYDSKKLGYFHKKVMVFFHHQKKGEKLFLEGFVE
jgi:hypothetical protein